MPFHADDNELQLIDIQWKRREFDVSKKSSKLFKSA
jgi:hypothetical protein